jgi:DNA primase
MDVKVASLPEGVDPADLISKNGKEAWNEAIRNSKHIIEFLLNRILNNKTKNDSRYIGREIKERILPYVDSINSSIEKSHFIKLISDKAQISEQALKDDLKKIEQELKFEKKETEKVKELESKMFRKDYIERRLLGIVLWQKTLKNPAVDMDLVVKEFADILKINKEEIFEKLKNNKEDLIFEAEVFYSNDVDLKKDVSELINNLSEEYLKEELFTKMQELHTHETDKEKSGQILKDVNEINNKIENIKSGRVKKQF